MSDLSLTKCLDRPKFLDIQEFLDRLECLDRPKFLDRQEFLVRLECLDRLECIGRLDCLVRSECISFGELGVGGGGGCIWIIASALVPF